MKFMDTVIIVLSAMSGAALGFLYYKKVGCKSGVCVITSNKYISVLYGAVVFGMLGNIAVRKFDLTPAPKGAVSVKAEEFRACIQKPGAVLLDVRTEGEYADGHIPGSVNNDVTRSGFVGRMTVPEKNTPICLYCRSGSRSKKALQELSEAGYSDLTELKGGITAWPYEITQ
jgi:rhodanese-related sulfurtransferase